MPNFWIGDNGVELIQEIFEAKARFNIRKWEKMKHLFYHDTVVMLCLLRQLKGKVWLSVEIYVNKTLGWHCVTL